jgi:hypothetical protein
MSQTLQMIKWSKSYGGARNVFTGSKTGVTSGQYIVDLTTLPDGDTGCVPAGTPIFIDDENRTIDVHYAFELYEEKATGTEATFQAKFKKAMKAVVYKPGWFSVRPCHSRYHCGCNHSNVYCFCCRQNYKYPIRHRYSNQS